MNTSRFSRWLKSLPTHIVLIGICLMWILPTIGLLVTSFRPLQDVNETGWWTIFSKQKGYEEYQSSCAPCHGEDGNAVPSANLTDPDLVGKYRRSFNLLSLLNSEIDGQPHMESNAVPDE